MSLTLVPLSLQSPLPSLTSHSVHLSSTLCLSSNLKAPWTSIIHLCFHSSILSLSPFLPLKPACFIVSHSLWYFYNSFLYLLLFLRRTEHSHSETLLLSPLPLCYSCSSSILSSKNHLYKHQQMSLVHFCFLKNFSILCLLISLNYTFINLKLILKNLV